MKQKYLTKISEKICHIFRANYQVTHTCITRPPTAVTHAHMRCKSSFSHDGLALPDLIVIRSSVEPLNRQSGFDKRTQLRDGGPEARLFLDNGGGGEDAGGEDAGGDDDGYEADRSMMSRSTSTSSLSLSLSAMDDLDIFQTDTEDAECCKVCVQQAERGLCKDDEPVSSPIQFRKSRPIDIPVVFKRDWRRLRGNDPWR